MIENILNSLYTSEVIEKMGDNFQLIYSWSAFSILLLFGLVSLISFIAILYAIVRWFK